MARQSVSFLEKIMHRRTMRRLRRYVRSADVTSLGLLRQQRNLAREMRVQIDELSYIAGERLALPVAGSNSLVTPRGTDWAWRPDIWRGPVAERGIVAIQSKSQIGNRVTLYHDCKISEMTMRQVRNTRERDLAPYGLRLDVFRFDGSFLSLAMDLPPEACHGLRMKHLVRVDSIIEVEKPIEIFARLNIKHGPNIEQIVREIPMSGGEQMVEFDLGYVKLNEKRIEKMWLDLIFEGPEMNQVTVRDITICRHPRAEL
jgi:hypothetical protein